MSVHVDKSAIVDPRAELDDDVEIGPLCVVGPQARIGRGTRLLNNVTIMGRVMIGEHNRIFPMAVIGGDPQYLKFDRGTASGVRVGAGTVIREHVTINRSIVAGGSSCPDRDCDGVERNAGSHRHRIRHGLRRAHLWVRP